MAKYLVKASYSAEGIKGVLKEGASQRVGVVKAMMEGLGGSMEAFYFSFGDSDLYVLADLPDNTAAAAVAAAVRVVGCAQQLPDHGAADRRGDRRGGEDGRLLPAAGQLGQAPAVWLRAVAADVDAGLGPL